LLVIEREPGALGARASPTRSRSYTCQDAYFSRSSALVAQRNPRPVVTHRCVEGGQLFVVPSYNPFASSFGVRVGARSPMCSGRFDFVREDFVERFVIYLFRGSRLTTRWRTFEWAGSLPGGRRGRDPGANWRRNSFFVYFPKDLHGGVTDIGSPGTARDLRDCRGGLFVRELRGHVDEVREAGCARRRFRELR